MLVIEVSTTKEYFNNLQPSLKRICGYYVLLNHIVEVIDQKLECILSVTLRVYSNLIELRIEIYHKSKVIKIVQWVESDSSIVVNVSPSNATTKRRSPGRFSQPVNKYHIVNLRC